MQSGRSKEVNVKHATPSVGICVPEDRQPITSIHVLSDVDNEASGLAYVVKRMCRAFVDIGQDPWIVALGDIQLKLEARGVPIVRCTADNAYWHVLAKLGRSRAMRKALFDAAVKPDVFHTHGLWMMPNVYPAEAAQRLSKPLVHSPHGMLSPDALKFSRTAKRMFWAVWQKRAAEAVSCFHATAGSEYEDIRAFNLTQPVAVIPAGIDLPDEATVASLQTGGPDPFVLSLGRIHPIKGLDRLIAAFALIADEAPAWRLRIVGPDEVGYAATLARQATGLGLAERVSIEEPVFGLDKLRLMREAEVFALSTLHENFGMTVAESLAVETPVISTKGAPWDGLVEHRCGWWIDHGADAMAAALREAVALSPDQRRALGRRGREWMARDFGWQPIVRQMTDVYEWLIKGGLPPATVRIS